MSKDFCRWQDAIYGEGNDDEVKAKPAAASKKRKTAEEEEDVKQQAAVIDFKVQLCCTKGRAASLQPSCKHAVATQLPLKLA